jgi:thymidine phosphorylase
VTSVGCGTGSFMADIEQARQLAVSMADVGAGAGVPTVMMITDLCAVLGLTAGNAIEVVETVEFLTGKRRDARTLELLLAIAAEMLVMGGIAPDIASATKLAQSKLDDGSAAERFDRIVAGMGGPKNFIANPAKHMDVAPVIKPLYPARAGYVAGMDCHGPGMAVVDMGGGRTRPEQTIDFAVGLAEFCQVGDPVGKDKPLCVIHARDQAGWERAAARILPAIAVTEAKPKPLGPIVLERIERLPK